MIPVEDVHSFRLCFVKLVKRHDSSLLLYNFAEVSECLPASATALSRVRSLKWGISTSD